LSPTDPSPTSEAARIAALKRYDILDSPAEAEFDDFTLLASRICGTPIALISLVDTARQWFKSKVGIDASETPREIAFCDHVIRGSELMEVPNALDDERFRENPLVAGAPDIRFYAGTPLITPDGHNLGTLCVIDRVPRHLTAEQREALVQLGRAVVRQMELRRTNKLFQTQLSFQEAILQSAASAIISTTLEGTITSFNRAAELMLGYTAEELVGRNTPGVFHDGAEVVARAAELSRELGRTIEPGFEVFVAKARAGGAEAREWTYVRKDGRRFPVSLSVTAVRNSAGAVSGFLGIANDVSVQRLHTQQTMLHGKVGLALTQRLPLREVLQECTEAMVEYLDAAFARVWTVNHETQVLELQASAGLYTHLDGPHGRVPVGKFKIGLIAAEKLPHLTNQVVGDPRVGDQEWAKREKMVAFAGYPLIVAGRVEGVLAMFARQPLPGSTIEVLGAVAHAIALCIARDRAEEVIRKNEARLYALNAELQLQAGQLAAANRELTDFAYIVSHDLKAPLRGISTLAGWLAADSRDKLDADGREQLDLLQTRVKRLDGLINGILSYSRAGRTREERAMVDFDLVVRNVIDLLAAPPHIRIEVETPLPAIAIEPTKVQQLFQNLLSNAIKFMDKPEGRIRVRCDAIDGAWRFQVADNGPGIEAKYFARIFELFQTLAPRDQVESTGVGLSLVKKIVENDGGCVWVESQPGLGATFHFTLPMRALAPVSDSAEFDL
jgi:PAS domain S-box-containing protein